MATLTLDKAQGSLLDTVEQRPRRAAPERPAPAREKPPASRAAAPARTGRTLDDLITGAWSALSVTQTAPCPLCGGDVVPRFGAGPQPVAGACRSCGTELS